MTMRRLTPEEVEHADADHRQWWLSVLTLGIIPRPPVRTYGCVRTPEHEREAEAG